MRSAGNGCLMLWVAGALAAAVATGLGSRGPSDGPIGLSQASERHDPDSTESSISSGHDVEASTEAIVLDRSHDGHFYADTEINGQTIRMLVDTGASAIALAREDARRAGIGVSIGMPQVIGQGAGGDVHGEVVSLDRVALGGTEAEKVHAVVLDQGQVSLLGQSFLSKFESVEIKGDQMVLR